MWCTQENAIVPVHLFEGHVIAGITRCRSGGNASERRSYCINKSRQNARGRRFRCLIVEDRRISYCPRSRFAVKLNALTFAYFFRFLVHSQYFGITIRNSAITDKPRDAFRGQSGSPNMVQYSTWFPISVPKTRPFQIFDFKKCCDLEIRVRGHLRSLKVVPCDRLCMASY